MRERETDAENKCMDIKVRKKGSGMYWEIGIDIYMLLILCIINENLLYNTGNSTQCSVVT